jgi:hypothetical protein
MLSQPSTNNFSMLGILPSEGLDQKDEPEFIYTPVSESAPSGRIFEDSLRGTLFWEARLTDDHPRGEGQNLEAERRFGGKPFSILWLSTTRVPFQRTQGLRNLWNGSKEIKVARDGTELEPSVGKQLIQLFYQ